jgi:hypothetical protein
VRLAEELKLLGIFIGTGLVCVIISVVIVAIGAYLTGNLWIVPCE